ncbi:unnamed protein product [Parajaminaea phylloscopi]
MLASSALCILVASSLFGTAIGSPSSLSQQPYEPHLGGQIAPEFPQEYSFSFKQHKWNQNGFGVNHLSTGAWFSSISAQKVRVDLVTLDWKSDNATVGGEISPSYSSSLFDYSKAKNGTVPNAYFYLDSAARAGAGGSCVTSDLPVVAAQGQLLKPSLLRSQGTYQGTEILPAWGSVDKWGVWFGDSILVTFFWAQVSTGNGASEPVLVRYDEYSAGEQTTVVTDIFDYRTKVQFSSTLFKPCAAGENA